MEVGGLGFFTTIAGNQPQQEKIEKLGIFAGMMATVLTGATNDASIETLPADEDSQSLTELAAFLNNIDLLEVDEGGKLLEDLISESGNLLGKALVHVGISDDEIHLSIQKWSGLTETPVKEIQDNELFNVLAGLLAGIANLSLKDLASRLDQTDQQVIKAIKLYDLMTKYADGYEVNHTNMFKESLKAIGTTLENYVNQSNDFQPTKYLQTRFTRLAAELNLSNSKKSIVNEVSGSSEGFTSNKTEGPVGTMAFLPQLTRAEQLTLMVNGPDKPVSPEQLMKQFESILSKSQFLNSGGTQKLFIKLFPEHLGSIRVELFQKDQVMMARIITATGTAKETLESQVHGLRQAFAAQNLTVDKIEIFQQPSQQERFFNRDPQQQHRQPDKQQQQEKKEKGEFTISFEEALLNTEV